MAPSCGLVSKLQSPGMFPRSKLSPAHEQPHNQLPLSILGFYSKEAFCPELRLSGNTTLNKLHKLNDNAQI